jgi:hypothetical protein
VARGVLEEGNSFGQRRKVVRGVPSIVGKIDEWLVATTMVKAWQKKWPKWWLRGGKEKLGRKMVFFFLSTLAYDLSFFKEWNPPLFIEGERGTCCLLWCLILALDSNRKNLNHWFEVAIMT